MAELSGTGSNWIPEARDFSHERRLHAVVYMGGSCLASDENALKYASKWLGKTTIAGVQTSVSEETPEKEEDASASITQPLMQETIRRLPVGMCLVLIKDMPATLDEKFCGYLK